MQMGHDSGFVIMVTLHFIAMYIFMYAMVNSFGNVFNNFNQLYMAALMTASMVLIELPLMVAMYKSKKLNGVIFAVGLIVLVGSFLLIRKHGGYFRSAILTVDDSPPRESDSNV